MSENTNTNTANPSVDQELELNGVQISFGPRITHIAEEADGTKTEVSEAPRDGEHPHHWSVYMRTRPAPDSVDQFVPWTWVADVATEQLAYLVGATVLGFLARK